MAGDRSEKKDIRVVSTQLALSTVAITEWLYFIFTVGRKKPDVTRKDILALVGFQLKRRGRGWDTSDRWTWMTE
jgi:hypothetical protein